MNGHFTQFGQNETVLSSGQNDAIIAFSKQFIIKTDILISSKLDYS